MLLRVDAFIHNEVLLCLLGVVAGLDLRMQTVCVWLGAERGKETNRHLKLPFPLEKAATFGILKEIITTMAAERRATITILELFPFIPTKLARPFGYLNIWRAIKSEASALGVRLLLAAIVNGLHSSFPHID